MSVQELPRPSSMDPNTFQDEMDLLDGPEYQDEVMDAELEPNEEDMLDVASKEDREAPQSEDLDMDEVNYEADEVSQDIIIEDLEPTENALLGEVPAVDLIDVNLPISAEEQVPLVDDEALSLENGSKETDASRAITTIDAQQQSATVEVQSQQDVLSTAVPDRIDERFEMAERITEHTSAELHSPDVQAGTSQPQIPQENKEATVDYTIADNSQVQPHDRSPPKELDQQSKAHVIVQKDFGNESVSRGSSGIESSAGDNHDLSSDMGVAHPITISFQATEMSLFAPLDQNAQSPETFLLDDRKLASQPLDILFQACRSLLEGSIEDYCEFEMHFHDLQLSIFETHADCANITLIQLVRIYIQLQQNDGNLEPPPMYVELSAKTNLRKQLQYLEESVIQKKGLSECVTQDTSDDEEILSPVPSDPEEEPRDNSLPIPSEDQQLDEIFDNDRQDHGEPVNQEINSKHFENGNADLVRRNSASRETVANTKDLDEIQETLGDHEIDGYVPIASQKDDALGSTSVTATNVVEHQDSTEHAAIEVDNAQSKEPGLDQAPRITEDNTKAEGSSTSSTLQGDILTAEEDFLEEPETVNDPEHVAINDVSDVVDLQYDFNPSGETFKDDSGEQPVEYARKTSDGSTKVQNGDTILNQESDPSQADFTDPSISLNEANKGTEEHENYADDTEADLAGSELYVEGGQGGEDDQITDNYHDDLLEEEPYGTDYQDPADDLGDHAKAVSQDHTAAAIDDPALGEEGDEVNLPETAITGDLIDQSLPVVDDKDDLTPQNSLATFPPKPDSQTPKSPSRKRSRGTEKDDYDLDDLEATPKKAKPT